MSKTPVRAAAGGANATVVVAPAAEGVTRFIAGEAARYLEQMTGAWFRVKQAFLRKTGQGLSPGYQWVPLEVLREAQERLARARKQAASPEAVRRIDLLEKWTAYGCTHEVWCKGPPRKYLDM